MEQCVHCILQRTASLSKRSMHTSAALQKYLDTVKSESVVKKRKQVQRTYFLTDESWANKILQAVNKQGVVLDKKTTIFECNPGSGILTKALLENDVNVVCWESRKMFLQELKGLAEEYESQLHLNQLNLFKTLPVKLHENIPPAEEGRALAVVGPVSAESLQFYISNLVSSHILPDDVFPQRHAPHFFITTHKECEMMVNQLPESHQSHSTYRHILYHHFFHTEKLLKIPTTAFSPSKQPVKQKAKWDRDHLYLVCLRPDWSRLKDLQRADVPGLVFLIQHLNQHKRKRLIPVVERCCQGLGLTLIQQGCSMLQLVSELSTEDYLPLYRNMLKSENYHISALKEETELYKQSILGTYSPVDNG